MKKVLLITYYWPPAGGAGVQRPLKFVKYLREFGWEPVVYTCDTDSLQVKEDASLLKDIPKDVLILKKKIWEPYSIFFKLNKDNAAPNGFKSFKKKSFVSNLLLYIRSNFFFPDAKMFWVFPSFWFLKNQLKKHKIDAIISTGPPHTTHLIALKLKKATGIPWIADFRDPWTKIEYFSDLKLSSFTKKLHFKYEREVLNKADAVIVVGKTMQEEFKQICPRSIHVITNGFDEEDFKTTPPPIRKGFNIVHTGTLRDTQNHQAMWQALAELCKENPNFKEDLILECYGFTDSSMKESALEFGLSENLKIFNYLSHEEIIEVQRSSRILLLIINRLDNPKRIITGKIFEYIASERPILLLGPLDGDAAAILKIAGHNSIADFNDKEAIKNMLSSTYKQYKSGTLTPNLSSSNIYTRRNLTCQLGKILDEIT